MTARAATAAAAEESAPRQSVVIFTTDELVPPEAVESLAPHFETTWLNAWADTLSAIEQQPPDALLLDIDTVGESSNDGLRALQQARDLLPDGVLIALT